MRKSPYDEGWLEGLAVEIALNHPDTTSLAAPRSDPQHEQRDGHHHLRGDASEPVTARYERHDRE